MKDWSPSSLFTSVWFVWSAVLSCTDNWRATRTLTRKIYKKNIARGIKLQINPVIIKGMNKHCAKRGRSFSTEIQQKNDEHLEKWLTHQIQQLCKCFAWRNKTIKETKNYSNGGSLHEMYKQKQNWKKVHSKLNSMFFECLMLLS